MQAITKVKNAIHGYQNIRFNDLEYMTEFTHTGDLGKEFVTIFTDLRETLKKGEIVWLFTKPGVGGLVYPPTKPLYKNRKFTKSLKKKQEIYQTSL